MAGIPASLEHLLLTGKAKHEIFSFVGGNVGAIEIQPDKIIVIYQVTIFPFTEQCFSRESGQPNPPETIIFQLLLNSEGNREIIPFKFAYHLWEDTRGIQDFKYNYPPLGSAVVLPVFTVCRNKLFFDLRKLTMEFCNVGENTPTVTTDHIQAQPNGAAGLSTIKTFDPLGLAPKPINYANDQFPNGTPFVRQNHKKFELPADSQTMIQAMKDRFNGFPGSATNEINGNSFPIILFNAVIINSSHYDKLLHT